MALNIISFALGLAVVAFLAHLWPLKLLIGLSILFLILLILFYKTGFRKILWLMFCFILGITWNDALSLQWQNHRVNQVMESEVTGQIISLPIDHLYYTDFEFETTQIDNHAEHKHFLLSWQKPHPALGIDEQWRFSVHIKPPHGLTNFGPFNRLRNLWIKNIHGIGYVINKKPFNKISSPQRLSFLAQWRQHLQQEINATVSNPTAAAIVTALTIGVEQGLSTDDWQVLRNTGTVHLVVIAGLHIGMMVTVVYFLTNFLWRRCYKLVIRYPAQQAGAWTALVFAVFYSELAGFGVPAQRALAMIALLMGNQLFYQEWSMWRRLLLAFLFVIVIAPGVLFTAGFWLSFSAVFWIAYALPADWRQKPKWRQWLRLQTALYLGLLPLTLYFFQQFSWVSLVANSFAVPWVGWLILPLCLLAALTSLIYVPISQWLFKSAAFLLLPLWHYLSWLSGFQFSIAHYPLTQIWILLIMLLGIAWILAPPSISFRWLGVLGFLPLFFWPLPAPKSGEIWLTVLDVGQGLAVVVQTSKHILIYDTGSHIKDGFDAGEEIITPYLQLLGIKTIDTIVVSHGDNDHSGGAAYLLNQWPVQRFLTSIPTMFPNTKAEFCRAQQVWQWDDVPFKMLGPPAGQPYQDNNSSCVLQIGRPGAEILLVGDIESKTEQWLVNQYGKQLQAKVLVVPHHGSRTSSSPTFLDAVQPQFALFSLGFFNRFHFPAPTVLKRYQLLSSQAYTTAENGAIRLKLSPDKPVVIELANPKHYFWQK